MSTDLNDHICFNFYNGWREITGFYKDVLGMDVTPQKFYVLELLELDQEITMNELSKGMKLDSSAVSTLVSRMEKKSLVTRRHGTEDRRTVFVKLTNEGHDKRAELRKGFVNLREVVSENISASDIAKLQEIVGKITSNHRKLQNAA